MWKPTTTGTPAFICDYCGGIEFEVYEHGLECTGCREQYKNPWPSSHKMALGRSLGRSAPEPSANGQ